jgi:DNA-binding CsgD family transcriptional regulator
VIPRCEQAWPFTYKEIAISKILAVHLENFYDALSLATSTPDVSRVQSVRAEASRAGLTRREQQIVLLLAEGLTMSEIADRLFISRRTVEKHAANMYAKLGIQKKRELHNFFRPRPVNPALS